MNIIKEALEKTLNDLNEKVHHHEELRHTYLTNKANDITTKMHVSFENFIVKVLDTEIEFRLNNHSWYDFRISRRIIYRSDNCEYGEPTIGTSSINDSDERSLNKLICLGTLAQHCLYKTDEWKELVSLMDETNRIYKENLGPLYKQVYQIQDELRKIENKERSEAFNSLFSKNEMKLNKRVYFYYGSGRYDSVISDVFFWEENKGGKTYTVSYMEERRTNPYYDENGNQAEPIFESTKRVINKRIRKSDLESFIRENQNYIAE